MTKRKKVCEILLLLLLSSQAFGVTIGWDASPKATSYEIFVGAESGFYESVYETTNTFLAITNGPVGHEMFMAVKALNGTQESDFSTELVYLVPQKVIVRARVERSDVLEGQYMNMLELVVTNFNTLTQSFYRASLTISNAP